MDKRTRSKNNTLRVSDSRPRRKIPNNSPSRRTTNKISSSSPRTTRSSPSNSRRTINSPRTSRRTRSSPSNSRSELSPSNSRSELSPSNSRSGLSPSNSRSELSPSKSRGMRKSPSTSRRQSLDMSNLESEIEQEMTQKESSRSNVRPNIMEDNAPAVLMAWVERKPNPNKNAKKTPKELFSASAKLMPSGISYLCRETYDTYLQGGLFPLLHITSDRNILSNYKSANDFLKEESLGENYNVEQAIYRQVASVTPPTNENKVEKTLMSVSAFKSLDGAPPTPTILREWKTWSGVRSCMTDILQAGLSCQNVKFYVKESPLNNPDSFHYVITTEIGITKPQDENTFIDVIQRFRVERWLGFMTVYKPYTR